MLNNILSILSGLIVVIPLVVELVKYVQKSIKEKNWAQILSLILKYMQEAENNINDSLNQFNLEYQQLRQTQITDELIDIISGSEEMNHQKMQSPLDFIKKKSKNNTDN